jgi:hypothetical protein
MLDRLGAVVPVEFAVVVAALDVEFEPLGGDLDEAFHRVQARACGKGGGQVILVEPFADEIGIVLPLQPASPVEQAARGVDANRT